MPKTKNVHWPPKFLMELWEVQEKIAKENENLNTEEIFARTHEKAEQVRKEIAEIRRKRKAKLKTPAASSDHARK